MWPRITRLSSHSAGARITSPRTCTLSVDIDRVERLAGRHEQTVTLGAAEADIAANLGQANASHELALRCPDGDAAVADRPAGIARSPQVAVHVAAQAVGAAFHPVDRAVGKQPPVRKLVVGADVEDVNVALAAGARAPGPLPVLAT